jgi:hypothetical protein
LHLLEALAATSGRNNAIPPANAKASSSATPPGRRDCGNAPPRRVDIKGDHKEA